MDLISAYRSRRDKGESLVAKKEKKERKKEEIRTHAIYLMILYGKPSGERGADARVRNRRRRIDIISNNAKVAGSREDNRSESRESIDCFARYWFRLLPFYRRCPLRGCRYRNIAKQKRKALPSRLNNLLSLQESTIAHI